MSKYMQLTVAVRSYYPGDLEGAYPKLERHLSRFDPDLVKQNPSLYELIGKLDQLLYRFEGTPLRNVLLRYREKLQDLHKEIKENIADWKLAQADKLLYDMEDIFGEIEAELD
jgi:hypothetical protein